MVLLLIEEDERPGLAGGSSREYKAIKIELIPKETFFAERKINKSLYERTRKKERKGEKVFSFSA